MAKVDLDYFYDKIKKENPSRDDMLEMVDAIDNTTSFGNSSFEIKDVLLAIAESGKMNDYHDIKFIYDVMIDGYNQDPVFTARILDQGTKKLFDELWSKGNKGGRWLHLWKSKYADGEQLSSVWNEYIINADKSTDKTWTASLKAHLLMHPNLPEKIMNKQLRAELNFYSLARNPNPSKKTKDAIAKYLNNPISSNYDGIYENWLRNSSIKWEERARVANLREHLREMLAQGLLQPSSRRQYAILDFCKLDETPDEVKAFMYEHTKDEDFLPQAAKDLFLF
jgi:hypothetical protein